MFGACSTSCCNSPNTFEAYHVPDKPGMEPSLDASDVAATLDTESMRIGTKWPEASSWSVLYDVPDSSGMEVSLDATGSTFAIQDAKSSSVKTIDPNFSLVQFCCSQSGSAKFEVVNSLGSAIVVTSLDKLSCFSKAQNAEHGLGIGDLILEVEGVSGGGHAMVEKLEAAQAKGGTVSLRVARRPATFEARIIRSGPFWKTLGCTVSPDKLPQVLWVVDVKEKGLIRSWNDANPHRMILRDDIIMAVNSIAGNPGSMVRALQGVGEGGAITLYVASKEPSKPVVW